MMIVFFWKEITGNELVSGDFLGGEVSLRGWKSRANDDVLDLDIFAGVAPKFMNSVKKWKSKLDEDLF